METYVETSAILLALSESDEGRRANELLLGAGKGCAVSDLVLSEIYNLPEPLKDRSTRLVVKMGVVSVRLTLSCFTLAEKYVYNRVLKGEMRDWGLHLATAAVRGFKEILTADPVLANLGEETNAINAREGYSEVQVSLLEMGPGDKAEGWLKALQEVRGLSYQASLKRGLKDTLRGLETSALHLMKEKSVKIERTGSIEIF